MIFIDVVNPSIHKYDYSKLYVNSIKKVYNFKYLDRFIEEIVLDVCCLGSFGGAFWITCRIPGRFGICVVWAVLGGVFWRPGLDVCCLGCFGGVSWSTGARLPRRSQTNM